MFILQGVRENIIKLLMAAIEGDNVAHLKQNFLIMTILVTLALH